MASVQASSCDVPAPCLVPDGAAIKQRQQATWASDNFSVIASRIVYQAEQLCETADLQAGWRVLDVATGSGNAALAAARRGCEVVGNDFFPPTPGLQPPVRRGEERYQRELFGGSAASITSYPRTAIFRFRSAEENVFFVRTHYGPTLRAFDALPADRREALQHDLIALAKQYDRNAGTGPIAIAADYLETIVVRK